jgi:glycosyltransferase involved in cell wall biosynthesis
MGLNFEFTFIGSGPAQQSTQASLRNFNNVRFLGELPNSEIQNAMQGYDIFVLLSDYEGLPLSLLEAMGQGLVPVVSDLESGMRQAVLPETGIRIPIGNVKLAAEAICYLARNPDKLAALGKAASEHVRKNFNATLMAERYLRLVSQLAKSEADWTTHVSVPVPLAGANKWHCQEWTRPSRRFLKRALWAFKAA